MKRALLVTAALVAAVAVWGVLLPPRRAALDASWNDGSVRGVLHVHSRASDGRGTLDDIARAAAEAGLGFVIVTDHGDGTRATEPPSYRDGVLVVDAVEISTRGGHYVALDLPMAPFPLGGEARAVVDDVRRLGGFGVAAHPDSPKPELRWTDWSAPIDAFELINPDSSWRAHAFDGGAAAKWSLVRALGAYPARPAEALAAILTQSSALRERWLAIAGDRPLVALAGADAHARVALRDTEPGDNSYSIPIPGYRPSFEAISVRVTPDAALTGDAESDSRAVIGGLRKGHVYLAVDGWAGRPEFSLAATSGSRRATQGDTLPAGAPVTLAVRSNRPEGYSTIIWKDAHVLTERAEAQFDLPVGSEPAVYSVEIRRPDSEGMPAWVTSNPIYVRREIAPGQTAGQPPPAIATVRSLFDGQSTTGWSFEGDPTSLAAVDVARLVDGAKVRLRYGLSGGSAIGQYAAAAVAIPDGADGSDGLAFTVRGGHPMRISVQARADHPDGQSERWERSVYVDAADRAQVVRFADMVPAGRVTSQVPPTAAIRAILFVVDTTNTKTGSSGQLWLGDVRLVTIR